MSTSPQHRFAPPGLLAPSAAAAVSAAFFAWAFYLASLGLGGGVAALLPSIIGVGTGLTSAVWLRQSWRRDWDCDRTRRALWIGTTAVLLLPFSSVVVAVVLWLGYAVLHVRP